MTDFIYDFDNDGTDDGLFNGCVPREDRLGENHTLFSSAGIETIPRDQWEETPENESNKMLVAKIKNQKQESSCTANNTTQNHEVLWNLMFGKEHWVELSPISIYRHCNGGRDRGSSVPCCMKAIRDIGALPANTPRNIAFMEKHGLNTDHVMDLTGYKQKYPQDYEQTAQHFRIEETYDIANFDEFGTALQSGFTVSYGRAGHSICGVRLVYRNGKWCIEYANSWSPQWGNNGYGYDTESYVKGSISRYGAIAVRTVVSPTFMQGN